MNKKEFIKTLIDMGGCGAETETWDRGWDDAIGEVIGIAEELDEPEKVVIPKFVADWIESLPENVKLRTIFSVKNHSYEEAQHWVWRNSEIFARAWLDGYEVEKEPQWVVRYEDGYFSEEIKFGCGIGGDWVDEVSRAYHFTDKAKAEAVALLIGGTVEEVTK